MNKAKILLLPGWQNSDAEHWQSHWQRLYADTRVEQADWEWPRRGDWMARLDEVILGEDSPVVLAAHSLGCQLVAAWAAHSQHTAGVVGALLVAPPDTEREDFPPQLHNWRPMVRQRLPFPAITVLSSNDPYCSQARGLALARDWGTQVQEAGPRGHLNTASALGAWPEGRSLLESLRGSTTI